MGFKKRLGVIVKSQINDWVTRAEDPEKILGQAVEEMEEGLEKARIKIGALRFRIDERSKLLKRTGGQIAYWQDRAEEYVRQGMDENAGEAVRKRRVLEEKERGLAAIQSKEESGLKEYEKRYTELESRVRAAKEKKAILLSEISSSSAEYHGGGESSPRREDTDEEPFQVFRRIEERVTEEVTSLEAARERQKDAWEKEERLIAEEVAALKKNVQKGGGKK